ncbi:uncharacterized protein EAF02_007685 [Botrytis sinoallii]|uniref:uncharacterized protein n=1 Tax=Botrytis sinoallii TaxID=1463999 RepID=UPI0018FFD91E|nr:uncharacterized protein EAF02_007685 [Botrytis sinoallii]KAF7880048.1 hypothetical protein EAF02_007685 [Botrytis sinoallii]
MTDEQATLGELYNDVFSEVPLSNNDEMPDTPNSPSTKNPPNEDYNLCRYRASETFIPIRIAQRVI